MPDQEVHEIQLNGKQLVFMFMAATVVSVVIFLCGVMVGRGVRQPVVDSLAVAPGTSIDPTTPPDPSSGKPAATVEPAPERENLTYAERLEAPTPLSEPLRLTETRPAVPPAVVEKTGAEKPVPPAAAVRDPKEQPARKAANIQSTPVTKPDAVVASSRFAEPQGKGVVFQVQAFPTIDAAEALAARLKSKGYPTFVLPNPDNPRGRYRVRVGKYSNKSEAETVFRRLKQEENFKPWRIP
ncbi:MAG TPA: SPOR domain-containing protein [Vicinamibacterales bacterium]|jgi:cell division septation protein DedD|nr:SPOR domain-containing protein [Vicinamibacterales bacterium]